ncbi:MAG: HAMP domain-containing histidine kinase [Virgibacillus proomii]|jgi:signal transduction histidine kinase
MNIWMNKEAKHFFLKGTFILLIGAILMQFFSYANAIQLKREIMKHDYELAGYLVNHYPNLSEEIPAVFTSDKTKDDLHAGQSLLKSYGYKNDMQIRFMPVVNSIYQMDAAVETSIWIGTSLCLFAVAFLFFKRHYQKIDQYQENVYQIMSGAVSTKLDDNEEGSLPKLAAAINTVTASLHALIEKEKHNRLFLKDLLTNISHQLKTPLSALAIYNEIMRNERLENDVITNFLKKSEDELERMETLIANLLKLAKLDAGIIKLRKSHCELNELIKQITTSFETRLVREQKSLEIKADKTVAYWYDQEWLLEAISNLIKNAIDHTKIGDRIEVHLEETPVLVKIAVYDNGEGIHPNDLNYIFNPFYRSQLSQDQQGIGIGLTLAKTIIDMHDGFISVESSIGKGTLFTVHLPKLTKL